PPGVLDRATARLLGANGPASMEPVRRSAEIGFWTAPWARGRGVAVAATRAVASWAFAYFGLDRLTWLAELGNHASRLVARRAGFRIGGELRLPVARPEGRHEAWVGSLLPDEVTSETPQRYAPGSVTARRATVFGAAPPALPLDGVPGRLRTLRAEDVPGV